jgi:hypothetical protein
MTMTFKALLAIPVLILVAGNSPSSAQGIGTPFGQSAENPGISAVGDVLGRYDWSGEDWFGGLGNVELGFQAPIDPFARADIILHYSAGLMGSHSEQKDEEHSEDMDVHSHGSGFAVEEALVTLTSLPGRIQLSAGRMRSGIGILNAVHLHDFSFIEYPMALTSYYGHEGLSVDGARLSWLAPTSFWLEVVLEGQRAMAEDVTDLGTAGLNLFFPIGDDVGLVLAGFGYADEPITDEAEHEKRQEVDGEEEFGVNGWGASFRLKWKPTEEALYRHLVLQGEVFGRTIDDKDHLGLYVMGEYLMFRRWTGALMFQNYELIHQEEHNHEKVQDDNGEEKNSWIAAAVSYWPSEFQRIRFQYDHPLEDGNDPKLTLQWTFVLGPHKPHAY